MKSAQFLDYVLDSQSAVDPEAQAHLTALDLHLRARHGMREEESAVGMFDLRSLRLAFLRADVMTYGASIPKIAILLAFFQQDPEAYRDLDPSTRHELGLMIKQSSNEMATKFSKTLGLATIQAALDRYGFYDRAGAGGIWMGKHYGEAGERIGDPIGDHSHGVTVRQLLRFYLLLEQGKLVSAEASACMREIFDSPDIPHDPIKFVKGLSGRDLGIRRKWGSWEQWLHDSAVITGEQEHYILVGLTSHARGEEYLEELAPAMDDWMRG
jgi:beta-lactamase class A